MVNVLQEETKTEKANHHVRAKITKLEGRIQELLAIGYDGGGVSNDINHFRDGDIYRWS